MGTPLQLSLALVRPICRPVRGTSESWRRPSGPSSAATSPHPLDLHVNLSGTPPTPTPVCGSAPAALLVSWLKIARDSSRRLASGRSCAAVSQCPVREGRGGHRRRHHIAQIRHTVIGRSRTVHSRDLARLDWTRPLFLPEVFSSRALPEKVSGRSWAVVGGRWRSSEVIGGHRWSSVAVVSREEFFSHLCVMCRPVRSTSQLNSAKFVP